jgi:glutamate--cysteine ligase
MPVASTTASLDVFLLHCLLRESLPDSPAQVAARTRNQGRPATRGREPGLMLERGSAEVALAEWVAQVLDECTPIAHALDAAQGGSRHREALRSARGRRRCPATAAGARVGNGDARLRRFPTSPSSAHSRRRRAATASPWPGPPRRRPGSSS